MMRTNIKHAPDEKCCIEFCENPARVLHMCNACYEAERKWAARPMRDRARRLQQVRKFEARLQRLRPIGRHLKVVK
jgi:hypothetical protein